MARIRPTKSVVRIAGANKNIVTVPPLLKPLQKTRYPEDNSITFERWFMEYWSGSDEVERIYLPIQWTALYCNNGYGSQMIVNTIQKFIDTLDANKKYYTIVQYDDGILNDIEKLNIKVFAMAGPRIDYPLPLLCTPHKFNFHPNQKRDIFASFVGSLTHSIRSEMIYQLNGKEGYYISTKKHSLKDYCEILNRSKYVLCPRGYGQSSFRIQEAIDHGAIPVYISDDIILPYNDNFLYGVLINSNSECFENIDARIKDEDLRYDKLVFDLNKAKQLFTYHGCKKMILQELRNERQNIHI